MLFNMDYFGVRYVPDDCEKACQQFLIADLNRCLHIHQTSMVLDNGTRIYGGSLGQLIMIAHGIGPEDSGERACTLALDAIGQYLLNGFRIAEEAKVRDSNLRVKLSEAFQYCQKALQREGDVIASHKNMGAELTLAYLFWPKLYVVHAGRAHCCLIRNGVLDRVNRSASSEVVGGVSDQLAPEYCEREIRLDDKLLLCSDGLFEALEDVAIAAILNHHESASTLCNRLIEIATASRRIAITVAVVSFNDGATQSSLLDVEEGLQHIDGGQRSGIEPPDNEHVRISDTLDDGADRGAIRSA